MNEPIDAEGHALTKASDASQLPGELLAQARESNDMSRIQLAELLGLTAAAIRDLELNRFDTFPSGIYVRGYLRNYSKAVGLDEQSLMDAYDAYAESHDVPQESPFGQSAGGVENQELKQKQKQTMIYAGVGCVAVLVLLLMVFS